MESRVEIGCILGIVNEVCVHISGMARRERVREYGHQISNTYFKTAQSVQITHSIEAVVKKLKYKALGDNQQVSPPAPTGWELGTM